MSFRVLLTVFLLRLEARYEYIHFDSRSTTSPTRGEACGEIYKLLTL
jgi:hypothetical protein